MSRSRKKVPITGITTAKSEKSFKVISHRSERHRNNQFIRMGEYDKLLDPDLFGDPYFGPKDGKCYWDDDVLDNFPKILRK